MQATQEKYGVPLSLSVLLHAGIVIFALVSIAFMPKSTPWTDKNKADQDIIQAVTVNQAQVQQQVQQIKAAQIQKQQQQQAQLQAIQQQAAALKKQQQATVQAAQDKLMKIQQQQTLAEQKLAQAQKQQAIAEKQQALVAKKAQQQADQAAALKKQQQAQQAVAQKKQLQLEQQFQQQVAAEQAKLAAARNQQLQSQLDHYKALIINAVSQQWIVPAGTNPDLACQLFISVAPGGMVLNVKVEKSSGNPGLDQSAVTAVYKASPLPVPADPTLFDQFRQLSLIVKPEQVAQG